MLQKHGAKSIKRLLILWFIHGQDNLIIISLMPTFLQIVEHDNQNALSTFPSNKRLKIQVTIIMFQIIELQTQTVNI